MQYVLFLLLFGNHQQSKDYATNGSSNTWHVWMCPYIRMASELEPLLSTHTTNFRKMLVAAYTVKIL